MRFPRLPAAGLALLMLSLLGCVYTNPRFMSPVPLSWQPETNRAYLFLGGMSDKSGKSAICDLSILKKGGDGNPIPIRFSFGRGGYLIQIEEGDYAIQSVTVTVDEVAPVVLDTRDSGEAAFSARAGRITNLGYVIANYEVVMKSYNDWKKDDYSTFMKTYTVPVDEKGNIIRDALGNPLYMTPATVPATLSFSLHVDNMKNAKSFITERYPGFTDMELVPGWTVSGGAPILQHALYGQMKRGSGTLLAFEQSNLNTTEQKKEIEKAGLSAPNLASEKAPDNPPGVRMMASPVKISLRREEKAVLGWKIVNTRKDDVYFYDQIYPILLYQSGKGESRVGVYEFGKYSSPLIPALSLFGTADENVKWMSAFITLKQGNELARSWEAKYTVLNGKRFLVLSGPGGELTVDLGTETKAAFRLRFEQYPGNRAIVASTARERKLVANADNIVTDLVSENIVEFTFIE